MHCRFVAAGVLAFFSFSSAAMAGECPGNPDALGTSRVISLDPAELKQLGTIQYKQTLPLEDHEVVLTFDDGPIPPNTDKVLDALAAECVKATFFVVGEMARAHPAALQRAYREGHSIGTHTEHHAHLDRMTADKARKGDRRRTGLRRASSWRQECGSALLSFSLSRSHRRSRRTGDAIGPEHLERRLPRKRLDLASTLKR